LSFGQDVHLDGGPGVLTSISKRKPITGSSAPASARPGMGCAMARTNTMGIVARR
jgi:hypothetical protein